jgi:hypothetical protein
MFNSYQEQMEQHRKDMIAVGGTLGKLGIALQVEIDPDERNRLAAGMIETLGGLIFPLRPALGDMEKELRAAGLFDKHREHFEAIKRVCDTDIMRVPLAQAPNKYEEVMTTLAYASLIQNALMDYKRRELFREYLPAADLPLQEEGRDKSGLAVKGL